MICAEPGPWCEGVRVWWVPDVRTGFLSCPRPPPFCRFFDLPPRCYPRWVRPSDLVGRPFGLTLGKMELELTAAAVVEALAAGGDTWRAVTPDEVTLEMGAASLAKLVRYGWARETPAGVELTEECRLELEPVLRRPRFEALLILAGGVNLEAPNP